GVPRGIRRTGRIRPQVMAVHDRFDAARRSTVSRGGWLVEARDTALLALLGRHGVMVRPRIGGAASIIDVERFALDSVNRVPRAFQGHREVRVVSPAPPR
ncbi:MAG TPA: hypothetical protein VE861_09095, partial [Gemmatimonadaceae bacterium]|nr:hypothetical protein [Gemmatimonadaceae bacterium]